ncbi:ABC transporter ATP-binding protein [Micromonospora sp. WMMD718]|uniref:ABC transporter ATP-binding protein n=1 Tax=Micromonospora aurantiaca (nom. illeg.) TaxID=47850 RepID=A0A6N3KAM3_9ACTN|nr:MULTISPECIES: ABC transporter ATP-binding protein [Micromonospora]AXH94732.1 ABC transporter ATP-binding protein [Micromonospora aurantiaca]MDG4752931.1 ABC transporter ATP-binding protein [Micromonospora sp. WMMD718]WDQ03297.1 ABC transporter ATP-binding protein [Micromonospora chalcea]
MLHIDNLTKVYRRGARANDGISLAVASGDVLGLLGHNGAGKTTLLNQVVGLARPTAGTITLLGRDPVAEPAWARSVCSFQPQAHAPLTGVTTRQAIEIIGGIRGGHRRAVQRRTAELLAALDIEEWADQPGERLSGGVRRLTAFCMAIVEPGRLVMLDEPTNDVDPVRRRLLWEQVRVLAAEGRGVVLVTHNIAEAERVIDKVVVLDHGRVAATGTPAALAADRQMRLELTVPAEPTMPAWSLSTNREGDRLTVTLAEENAHLAVAWAQSLTGRFSLNPISLEEVYVTLTENPEAHRNAALVP